MTGISGRYKYPKYQELRAARDIRNQVRTTLQAGTAQNFPVLNSSPAAGTKVLEGSTTEATLDKEQKMVQVRV